MIDVDGENEPYDRTNMYAQGPLPTPKNDANIPYMTGHRPVEVILQQHLQHALERLRAMANDPTDTMFDRLFGFYTDEQTFLAFKEWIKVTKITVHKNFPKVSYPLPVIGLHTREDNESETQFLGDHEALTVDTEAEKSAEILGQMIRQTLDVVIITTDADTTLLLYRVVWYLIFANKMDLEQYADMHNLVMSGGAIAFDSQTFPNWQYSRMITLKYDTLFDHYLIDSVAPKAVKFSQTILESALPSSIPQSSQGVLMPGLVGKIVRRVIAQPADGNNFVVVIPSTPFVDGSYSVQAQLRTDLDGYVGITPILDGATANQFSVKTDVALSSGAKIDFLLVAVTS